MLPFLLLGAGAVAAKAVHSLLSNDGDDNDHYPHRHTHRYLAREDNSLAIAQEETKRQQLQADTQNQQHAMTQTRMIMQTYLEKAFAERADLLAKAMSQLDLCIATNNIEGINALVKMVINVNEQSPLAEINKLLAKHGINPINSLSNHDLKGMTYDHH